ncbi:MAG: porphobilinogen synthase [Thalassobaculaceae bacterium]|nr:porphobilinogen synthase [Thalassobaculaceae bacterium]
MPFNGRPKTLIAPSAGYPTTRLRRPRQAEWSRRLVAENALSVNDLIWPIFVHAGDEPRIAVESMPGVLRYSVAELAEAAREAADLGIPVIGVFPYVEPDLKDAQGTYAVTENNVVCQAVEAVKNAVPTIGVMCDAALDPFTSHGHDGLLEDSSILNDETVEILVRQSVLQASAGCDIISPSDMMDGRVGAIRKGLDEAGFQGVQIMSYAAKYASGFYAPFRAAVGSASTLGSASKSTYQMDPANSDEALREVALDIAEGADMVMVKPGMPYLDIVRRVKDTFGVPTYAYQVSGEYSMIMAATERGWIDGERAMMESLLGFKRAGADGILTYFAVEAAKRLK